MSINPCLLAEMTLELSWLYDNPKKASSMPRAEWRWFLIDKAINIIKSENITEDTEDIHEIVENYLCKEERFGE